MEVADCDMPWYERERREENDRSLFMPRLVSVSVALVSSAAAVRAHQWHSNNKDTRIRHSAAYVRAFYRRIIQVKPTIAFYRIRQ